MSTMTNGNSASAIRRTAAEEQEDYDQIVKNLTSGAYLDWPNKAGFTDCTEHRGPIELSVKGTIPTWAAGSFFRNGPGAWRIDGAKPALDQATKGEVQIAHWFDGLAHLHRFDITVSADRQVKVFYSSRRQTDTFVKKVQERGTFGDIISFGQKADPCVGIYGKAMSCYKALNQGSGILQYDNMNVMVFPGVEVPGLFKEGTATTSGGHRADGSGSNPKKMWITSDTAGIRAVDAATLEPIGDAAVQSTLHPDLKGAMSCAHAQRDPKTGDIFNYNIENGLRTFYRIFRVSAATGKTDILATYSRYDVMPAYIHSFFLSERFVILRVPSTHFGKFGLIIPWKFNLVEAIEPFSEKQVCKWIVVDRIHGQGVVGEFETPAGFFFHTVNAWDEVVSIDDQQFANIYCDVIDFPNTDILHKFYHATLLNANNEAKAVFGTEEQVKSIRTHLVRWKLRVPLPTATTADKARRPSRKRNSPKPEQVLGIPSPHTGEMPTINPRHHTRPYRYVYSNPQSGRSTLLDTIVKTDLATREALTWNNPPGHTPGEAIFVARPGAEAEDDGVLLSVVLDGYEDKSYLLCLDARNMEELGRAEMEFGLAFGLHGVHTSG